MTWLDNRSIDWWETLGLLACRLHLARLDGWCYHRRRAAERRHNRRGGWMLWPLRWPITT